MNDEVVREKKWEVLSIFFHFCDDGRLSRNENSQACN